MKKSILIILSCCMMLFIYSGCTKKTYISTDTADRLSTIQAKGILNVCTAPDYPPYEYHSSGKLQGLDIEIAGYIAEKLGVKLHITETDFDTLLTETAKGTYDLAISAINHKEKREQNLLFSSPYLYADTEYGYQIAVDENALCVVSAKDGKSDTLIIFVNSCIDALTLEGKIIEWYTRFS